MMESGAILIYLAAKTGRFLPESPRGKFEALQWLIDDPSARARLGQAALDAARGPYSWESAARQTLGLYRSLL